MRRHADVLGFLANRIILEDLMANSHGTNC